ncbi:MAG: hypothetical protein A3K10_06075 [Bacteroidetes bacterium RIFCSPLOWO2_12_FULL_31_6]|nr:MAG: hypothetical protein A3K10_06075 [Bacteroidetes bacterium RIFCSPLOWO2_12_FULL_31_6]
MTKFWYALGDSIQSVFPLISKLGSGAWDIGAFNVLLMLLGFAGFIFWLSKMAKYEKSEKKFS